MHTHYTSTLIRSCVHTCTQPLIRTGRVFLTSMVCLVTGTMTKHKKIQQKRKAQSNCTSAGPDGMVGLVAGRCACVCVWGGGGEGVTWRHPAVGEGNSRPVWSSTPKCKWSVFVHTQAGRKKPISICITPAHQQRAAILGKGEQPAQLSRALLHLYNTPHYL